MRRVDAVERQDRAEHRVPGAGEQVTDRQIVSPAGQRVPGPQPPSTSGPRDRSTTAATSWSGYTARARQALISSGPCSGRERRSAARRMCLTGSDSVRSATSSTKRSIVLTRKLSPSPQGRRAGSRRSTPPRHGRSPTAPPARRRARDPGLTGPGHPADRTSSSPARGQRTGRPDRSPPTRRRSKRRASRSTRTPGPPAQPAPGATRRGRSLYLIRHRAGLRSDPASRAPPSHPRADHADQPECPPPRSAARQPHQTRPIRAKHPSRAFALLAEPSRRSGAGRRMRSEHAL